MGEHRKTTVIDGMEMGTVITILADNVTVCNFSIQNSGDPLEDWENGMTIRSNNNTIKHNVIGPKNYDGIIVSSGNNNTIYRNTFYYNQNAMIFSGSNHNEIIENNIGFSDIFGIQILDSHDNLFQRNNFLFNMINTIIMGTSEALNENTWEENYWSFPINKPKRILTWVLPFKISFQYDHTPAVHPNGKL